VYSSCLTSWLFAILGQTFHLSYLSNFLGPAHGSGVYVGVLSNTPEAESLRNEVASGGVLPYTDCVFTGSPVGKGKPDAYALLHFAISAWGARDDNGALDTLNEAYARKDAASYVGAADQILESLKRAGTEIHILTIGDGIPDIKVGRNARELLAAKGFADDQIRISSLALTYGFMTEQQLAQENPDSWGHSPREMATQTKGWLDKISPHQPAEAPQTRPSKRADL
jgi:phosphoglycolate phosphatase-like HAD superfamily hydrolase